MFASTSTSMRPWGEILLQPECECCSGEGPLSGTPAGGLQVRRRRMSHSDDRSDNTSEGEEDGTRSWRSSALSSSPSSSSPPSSLPVDADDFHCCECCDNDGDDGDEGRGGGGDGVVPLSPLADSGFYEQTPVPYSHGPSPRPSPGPRIQSSADPAACLPRFQPAVLAWRRHSVAPVLDLTDKVETVKKTAIAHGGFSDIYLGTLECEGGGGTRTREVAIKLLRVLTRQELDGVRLSKRLDREVHVWHRLDHPNVAKFIGISYHMWGRPAMIMDWYKNGNATQYLRTENPDADRLSLIKDVVRGLRYLHTLKPPIVHGDLKANNILIDDDGHAVICDFGLSKVLDELVAATGTTSSVLACSVRWQAPELIFDEDMDDGGDDGIDGEGHPPSKLSPASDVWAFACAAYELLSGNIPYFHRRHDWFVIQDIMNGVKPGKREHCPVGEVWDAVWGLISSCWNIVEEGRPRMLEVESRLEELDWNFSFPRP